MRVHGTPLHWSTIQRMAQGEVEPSPGPVETYRVLADFQDLFDRLAPGVYLARQTGTPPE
jgi:hypothetical protein